MYMCIHRYILYPYLTVLPLGVEFCPHPSIPGFNQERRTNNTQFGGHGYYLMGNHAESCKPSQLPIDW